MNGNSTRLFDPAGFKWPCKNSSLPFYFLIIHSMIKSCAVGKGIAFVNLWRKARYILTANAKRILTSHGCFRCEWLTGVEHSSTLMNYSFCDVKICMAFPGSINRTQPCMTIYICSVLLFNFHYLSLNEDLSF